jgi:cytoskeletal protein RodZ
MSDRREIERDPNLSRNRYVGRNDNSGWIVAGVIVVILLGVAAFSYRGVQMTSSSPPATTSGQSTRAPVPTTLPTTPVAPTQPTQPTQ